MSDRAIIHVDMDAFYASVAQRDDPTLRGQPVIVGGLGQRGVVAAASYEARRYGVRSAMPMSHARKRCPHALCVRPDMARYREVSAAVFAIFRSYTPLVEGLSLDEAFLDVTGPDVDVRAIGRDIKRRIARETHLTASVGMAHNKMLAKLASDYDKPDGFVYVAPDEVRRFLDPLPVRRLWGVGARTWEKLRAAGMLTIGDLRRAESEWLASALGDRGAELQRLASGVDHRPVKPERATKSISQEETFENDITSMAALEPVIRRQAERVAARLARKGLYARTVTIKLRSSGFSTLTRSETLPGYTTDARRIEAIARGMLQRWSELRSGFAVRLIGVGVSGLVTSVGEETLMDGLRDADDQNVKGER